jgi:hypothetical protein
MSHFVLTCQSPPQGDLAMLTYKRDHPLRSWASGKKFSADPAAPKQLKPPPEPVRAEVKAGYAGIMAELWQNPVPLMTRRLHQALVDAGVTNLDVYAAEIVDPSKGTSNHDYVAFNLVGALAAPEVNDAALMFRRAESVNAIMVHEKVKQAILAKGIDTLTFLRPEEWAG